MAENKGQPDNQSSDSNQQKPGAPNAKMSRSLLSYLVLSGFVILLISLLSHSMTSAERLKITAFETLVENDGTKSINFIDDGWNA